MWFHKPMIGSSGFLCSKPSTPTLAGRQKKNRPAAGGKPNQRAAIMRMIWPLENASTSPSHVAHARNKTIGAASDISRRFTVGTTVAKQFPPRTFVQDVLGQLPLEAAVVPFHEVGIDFRHVPQSRPMSHVFAARCKGLVKTRAKEYFCNFSPIWRARSSPRCSAAGRFDRCAVAESVQAVSPCRVRNSLGKSDDMDFLRKM